MSCYGDDFCCEPPDDPSLESYTCAECGMPWYRVQLTQLLPEAVRQGGSEFRVALDLPTTGWSTRRP